ncbi:MAG: TIGR00725 family protein [Candidatus Binatia bacterium]
MTQRRIQIAVIGAGQCSERVRQRAEQVGAAIGRHGITLVCGGLGGVMEAVACGAHEAGGLTVGILPSYDGEKANPWLDVVIPTGLGHGRNIVVVASGDAVIALAGGHGTAAEIALALKLGRCVVALDAWDGYEGLVHADSPEQAVDIALGVIGGAT